MKIDCKVLTCLTFLAGTLAAQNPTFTGVVNPASDLPPGVPNYGIAQGSVFIVYGSNLTSGNSLVQAPSLPLLTSLNATALTVTQNNAGIPIPVPLLYVSPGQLAAIMPSNAPLGNVTLTVSNGGKNGSTQVLVVASAFGISTGDGSGNGVGAVTFPDNSYVTTSKSAKPGDVLTLWGTGLGPLASGVSDAGPAPFNDLKSTVQMFIGGVPVTVQYAGRSPGAVGLDQINFVVPATAPLGCTISILVQTTAPNAVTSITSNGPTMAIASTNGPCTDPVQNLPQSSIPTFLSQNTTKVLVVKPQQNTSYNFPQGGGPATPSTTASAAVYLLSFTKQQISSQITTVFNQTSSMNSCRTAVIPGAPPSGSPNASGLDGGTSALISTSGGSISLAPAGTGYYTAAANSVKGGTYQLSLPGGADVKALIANFPIPQPSTWSNVNQLLNSTIDRTKPLTITWTGADPNAYVEITGGGQLGPANNPTYTIFFDCAAPASAGTFSIPPAVLADMPTGPNAFASINFNTNALPASMGSVPGFDLSLNLTQYQTTIPVIFK